MGETPVMRWWSVRRWRWSGLVLLIACSLALPLPPQTVLARPQKTVVAADGSGDYRTIGAAVRNAAAGDTIVVRPGLYREAITIDKELSIVGDGERDEIVLVAVRPRSYQKPGAIHFKRGVAEVSGITIREPEPDLPTFVDGSEPDPFEYAAGRPTVLVSGPARATVRDTLLTGPVGTAVAVEGSRARLRMTNDVLADTGVIFIGPETTATIRGNEIAGYRSGIVVAGKGARAVVRDNAIRDAYEGIRFASRASGTVGGNDIERVRTGVTVEGRGTAPLVRSNRIEDASFAGIAVLAGPGATIEANEVSDSAVGILVDGRVIDEQYDEVVARGRTAPLVRANVLSSNGRGIAVAGGATPRLIDNRIEDSALAAIDVAGSRSRPVVRGNVLRDNAEAIRITGAAKPEIGPNDITVAPDIAPDAVGRDIVVAADGSGDVATIRAGIQQAADGDRVLVRPGTYAEEVVVRKAIELLGDGARADIVIAVAGRAHPRPALVVQDSRATLTGFTVDTDLPPGSYPPLGQDEWTAFQVLGGAPTIDSLSVIGETGLLVSDGSRATVVGIDLAVDRTALIVDGGAMPTIVRNVVAGDTENGSETAVQVSGNGTLPEVRENDIKGGVLVGFGSAPIIESNRIRGRISTVGAADGTLIRDNDVTLDQDVGWPGISLVDCQTRLEDNDIGGDAELAVLVGVLFEECEASRPAVTGNAIHVTGTGIEVRDTPTALIAANDIVAGGPGIVLSQQGLREDAATVRGPVVRGNSIRSDSEGIVVDPGVDPVLEDNSVVSGSARDPDRE